MIKTEDWLKTYQNEMDFGKKKYVQNEKKRYLLNIMCILFWHVHIENLQHGLTVAYQSTLPLRVVRGYVENDERSKRRKKNENLKIK